MTAGVWRFIQNIQISSSELHFRFGCYRHSPAMEPQEFLMVRMRKERITVRVQSDKQRRVAENSRDKKCFRCFASLKKTTLHLSEQDIF